MDPIYISNQTVFENVQASTLEEPVAKSTILYANRFTGVGEVQCQDEELQAILESTIGNSGNNVLVQLKQKLAVYKDGPWYIDSNDGVVYIHNRKFTETSVHTYTYAAEPGEVLSASFRIIEVYKNDMAGISGFISAATKAFSMLQASVENPPERPFVEDQRVVVEREINQRLTCQPDALRVDMTNTIRAAEVSIQIQDINRRREEKRNNDNQQRQQYNSETPQQRAARGANAREQAYQSSDKQSMITQTQQKYPEAWRAWGYYKMCCEKYGENSDYAKQAYEGYKQTHAENARVNTNDTQRYWATFNKTISATCSELNSTKEPSASKKDAAIRKAAKDWERANYKYVQEGSVKVISNGPWRTTRKVSRRNNTGVNWADKERFDWTQACQVTIQFFGYFPTKSYVTLDRLIRDANPVRLGLNTRGGRTGGVYGNPAALLRNAAANIGKGKKEKQLQATIRVIGNPELETAQQIIIQNVGKKYSGVWYIKTVSHDFEHGMGYICDLTLSKQKGKSSTEGTSTTVNTQKHTGGQGTGTTSKQGRPKANVVSSNTQYTYADALNEPWNYQEYMYVQQAMAQASTPEQAREIGMAQAYNIADVKMYNHQHGTNRSYVTAGAGGTLRSNPVPSAGLPARQGNVKISQLDDLLKSWKKP